MSFLLDTLPQCPGLRLDDLVLTPTTVVALLISTSYTAACPHCGTTTDRIHSHYRRTVADLPCHGRILALCLVVRRFRCINPACTQHLFCERLPQLLQAHARSITRLSDAHCAIGFALGGEAGSRLAEHLDMPTSPDTLLRRVKNAPDEPAPPPRYVGIDDRAIAERCTSLLPTGALPGLEPRSAWADASGRLHGTNGRVDRGRRTERCRVVPGVASAGLHRRLRSGASVYEPPPRQLAPARPTHSPVRTTTSATPFGTPVVVRASQAGREGEAEEQARVDRLRAWPVLQEALDLAASFAAVVRRQATLSLSDWLRQAEHSGFREVAGFAAGLRQDEAAVGAAFTTRWSNGPVEGQVNRLKVIKRQMYGRAGLRLLRARVVNAA